MASVSVEFRNGTTESVRQDCRDCRETDKCVGDVLSDIAKHILWPHNTAAHIAAKAGCSVRQAERYLGGHEWSGDAVAAVMQEILDRRKMRNVRVAARR